MKSRYILLLLLTILPVTACRDNQDGGAAGETRTVNYTFDTGPDGFVHNYADLPVDADPQLYGLLGAVLQLPQGVPGFGYFLKGENQSGDLFMYVKRQVTGLQPDTAYDVQFNIELVTAIPEGIAGINGSPGESVYVKAGATTSEPVAQPDDQNWLRMNIDKGNQSEGGDDMIVLGHIAYEVTDPADDGSWTLKPLDNAGQAFTVTTDNDGAFWLIAGIDSAFEGLSAVYFASISATLAE